MKKLTRLLFLVLLGALLLQAPLSAFAQSTQFNSGFISGTQCVPVPASGLAMGSYSVTGSWTGTLTAYGVVGQGSPVSLQSQTANGSYTVSSAGYTLFEVCGNSVASGTAFVQVYAGGVWVLGGGGGFPVTSAQTVSSGGSLTPSGTGIIQATNAGNSPAFLSPTPAVWNRQGPVLEASVSADQNSLYEPTVICDTNPQLISGVTLSCQGAGVDSGETVLTNAVMKMYFSCGFSVSAICYAESTDGFNWTRKTGTLLATLIRPDIVKIGSTYYLFTSITGGSAINLYTATDGVTFTLNTSGVITVGTGGAWDSGNVNNSIVWVEGSTWYMLYDGSTGGGGYQIGLATASAAAGPWTKSGSNPVVGNLPGTVGHPNLHKLGSTYWMWALSSGSSTGVLPSDTVRYTSTNLTSWTQNPSGVFVYPRATADEGAGALQGQVADPYLVEVNGRTLYWYDAAPDQGSLNSTDGFRIKLAVADMPFSQLVTTNEGANNPQFSEFTVPAWGVQNTPYQSPGGWSFPLAFGQAFSVGSAVSPSRLNLQYGNTGASQVFDLGVNLYRTTGSVLRNDTTYTGFGIDAAIGNTNAAGGVSVWTYDISGGQHYLLTSLNYNAPTFNIGPTYLTLNGSFGGDVSVSRLASGVVGFGNGTLGSTNAVLKDAAQISVGTTFTSSAGCTETTLTGGATAGSFLAGATACTTTITMGNTATSPNGWACSVWDVTTTTDSLKETASTATTVTFSGTVVLSDKVIFSCLGF